MGTAPEAGTSEAVKKNRFAIDSSFSPYPNKESSLPAAFGGGRPFVNSQDRRRLIDHQTRTA